MRAASAWAIVNKSGSENVSAAATYPQSTPGHTPPALFGISHATVIPIISDSPILRPMSRSVVPLRACVMTTP